MTLRPNYGTLRSETKFSWWASSSCDALLGLSGIPLREFNLNPDAGIEAYRRGRPLFKELWPEIPPAHLSTPAVSYGHVNALGLELTFPEGGEVNYAKDPKSLAEWREILAKPVDFATAGKVGFFMDYKAKLEKAFPGEKASLHWGHEGPLTTAYELRDSNVFSDPYDDPEGFKKFLDLLTRSIVDFVRFRNRIGGSPEVNPEGGGMCDDVASMFGPWQWDEFVMPYWEQYFSGITTGRRSAHVEDLRKEHLPFLDKIGLWNYDPSVSAKINPRLIRDGCHVPFGWRLVSFHYPNMTAQEVRDWVFQAAADGASSVFTYISAMMCDTATVPKVRAFIEAAKEATRMFEAGATTADVGRNVSEAGRRKFWAG